MGKVIRKFTNGPAGTVSRANDNVIVSMKNDTELQIAFGAPVFLASGENACKPFDASTCTADNFLGFASRSPVKTPETYGSNTGAWNGDDPVEVLVRGSIVLYFDNTVTPGSKVYVRKSDGKLVTSAGAEGTTILLPNVIVRCARDTARCAEVVVSKRNIF